MARRFHSGLTVAALASGLAAVPAHAAAGVANGLQAMRELNLIVLCNMTAQGGEVEGKAFVGGKIFGASFQIGFGNGGTAAIAG